MTAPAFLPLKPEHSSRHFLRWTMMPRHWVAAFRVAWVLGCGIGTQSALSSTTTWLPASGNWGIGTNWSGGIPSSSVDALIDNSRTALVPVGTSGTVNGLFIGYSGFGTLTVQGGSVSSGKGYIGYFANSSGTATVSSGTWNSSFLTVGRSGTGTLNISGGKVTSTYIQSMEIIGDVAGSTGTVNVTNGGTWDNSTSASSLWIGNSGNGTLNINGGIVSNANGAVGYAANSNGTVTVASGTWNNLSSLTVGSSGTGSLSLNASGVVTVNGGNGTLTLGANAGSVGTLNLGTGSVVGTLNAATVNGGSGSATVNFNHTGSCTFSSNLTGSLSVNKLGSGTTVLTGSTSNYSGLTTISAGELDVNGSLSTGGMVIGSSTGGALRISGGIVNGWGILGHDAGSVGTAIVSSGTWNADGLTVGANGTGTLTIGGGGVVNVGGGSGTLYLANQYGSIGTLNMGDGITVGALNASGISVGSGTATVNFNHAGNYTFTQSLAGNVSINKLGSGTTTLAGNQYQLNSITVSAGELDVNSFPYYAVQTDSIVVGGSTGGALSINGCTVNSNSAFLGRDAGTVGMATVSGGTWASNYLYVGGNGTGTLTIGRGGVVNVGGGSGTLNLAGALNMGDGNAVGTLNASGISIGSGSATVNFNHTGSYTFSTPVNGYFSVNHLGSGTTTLCNYYQISSMTVSAGELDVRPNGLTSIGNVLVGGNAGGTLNINGSTVYSSLGVIGSGSGSFGTAAVSSGTWICASGAVAGYYGPGTLTVGGNGAGTLNINSSVVYSDLGVLGSGNGSFGTATISSGTWNAAGLTVGANGTGTLTIGGGGVVNVGGGSGTLYLGSQYGSVGTLNMGDGSTVGMLNASGISVGSGTAAVNFNHAGNYTFTQNLIGNVSINKQGSGSTTLAGSYQINTMMVSAGEMSVNGYLRSFGRPVNVASGATLSGSGTINGGVTVNGTLKGTLHTGAISGSGLISPGDSPGITTATFINPSGGISFAFEFTLANTNPIYSNAAASGNDILHLTDSAFTGDLTTDNLISIYLQSAVAGDTYLGGFFTSLSDAQLEAAIQNAKFAFYVEDDANGTITFYGKKYSSMDAALIAMGAVQVTGANFADGTVNGSELKVTVVPEPSTWAFLIGGAGVVGCFRRCRKREP